VYIFLSLVLPEGLHGARTQTVDQLNNKATGKRAPVAEVNPKRT
jgi:hypothetical protein